MRLALELIGAASTTAQKATSHFNFATLAAFVSAAAAWGALVLSIANRRTSRQMLQLSRDQRAESEPDLKIALGEGLSYRPTGEDCRVLALSVFVDNPSSSDDSLARADLEIRYWTRSGAVMTIKLQHDPKLANTLPNSEIAPLALPARVPSFGSVTGWMLFRLADGVVADGEIDGYRLTVHDTRGLRDAVETVLLREVVDEAELDASS